MSHMDHVSSSSSCSSFRSVCSLSNFESPISPVTPLRFSGIPFKWEEHPGVPKPSPKSKYKEPCRPLLPPPLPRYLAFSRNKPSEAKGAFDPFTAALVSCSMPPEELQRSSSKMPKTTSFRFIALYGSCKNIASVVDPTVDVHKSRRSDHSRTSLVRLE